VSEESPADDRLLRREVFLSTLPVPRRPGREAVLRSSLVVVYARAVRTAPGGDG